MALEQVRLGTPPAALDGDDPRTAFTRINNNFQFLDTIGVSAPIGRPVPNDDCNQAVTEGWWNATSGAAINRPPDMDYALIYVVTANSGFIVQNALDLLTGLRAGRSFNANISTWGAWGRELSPADFGTAAFENWSDLGTAAFENWSDLGTAAFAALATSTTDSTAGRVLRVGDHGVGGDVPYLGSPDLNNLSVPNGDYFVATPTNSPVSYGMLSHRVRSGEVYQRIASMGTAVLRTFERTKANSSPNWGSWVETTPSGIGQSWQAVSRALGTAYTNTTGRTIYITALVGTAGGQNQAISVQIAGVTLPGAYTAAAGQWLQIPPTPVPPGAAYALVPNGAGQPGTLNQWYEYR